MSEELVWATQDYKAALQNLNKARSLVDLLTTQFNTAGSDLVDAIQAAGLTEYGPITSELVYHEPSGEHRRVWKAKDQM